MLHPYQTCEFDIIYNTGFETRWLWQLMIWAPVLLGTLSHLRLMPTSTQTKSFNQTSEVAFLRSCQGFHHHCLTTLTRIFFPSPGDVNITGNSLEVPVTGRHGHHGFVAVEEQLGRQELSKYILIEPQDSEALVVGNTFVLRYIDWTVVLTNMLPRIILRKCLFAPQICRCG